MAHRSVDPNIDIYDEEFNRNLMLAKGLISQLRRKQEREICSKWITKLCNMRSNDATVKKNRNQFFKYMLTVLHRGIDERPPPARGQPQFEERHGVGGEIARGANYMSRWSQDKRTYVAVKPLPGKGALVYMAVAKDPELGWEYHR